MPDVTDDRVDRQARIVCADLSLDSIAPGAEGARSNLSFHGGAEGPNIHVIFERIVEIRFSVSLAPPVASWKPIKESARIAHGMIVNYAVRNQRVLPAVSKFRISAS
jgi:hypothetical protein